MILLNMHLVFFLQTIGLLIVLDLRSYKNGYVWNDLAENDIIYPTEGAEYVLKGSELIEGCTGILLV